uniref:Translation initiation factor IF-2, chloroplastic n=1 Tax=Spermothamnion repens TaxID=31383 RepID=A0A4D6WXU5_9FLOR|nr:Translation initiation factor 2 [Spermothamnion repens]
MDIDIVNKLDKKHKITNINKNETQSINEGKKHKSKTSRKNRQNTNANKRSFYGDDSTNIEVIKNHKFNKIKRKEKNKLDSNNSLSIENTLKSNQSITIDTPLTVQELSYKLSIPEAEIITYLFLQGIALTVNQLVDISIAKKIASHYSFSVEDTNKELNDNLFKIQNNLYFDSEIKETRAPIITIFGHVDHGKTTLLDSILKTNLAQKEHGGITQSINGYEVDYLYQSNIQKLVFLDTPGHEAFYTMRSRGAQIADIVLLVIAADDGLKPQSIEAIKAILDMKLSYIIVINKIDKPNINISYIKEELTKYNIISSDWGGEAIITEVSALTGQNLDKLMSNICRLSQSKDLYANSNQVAQGTILEAYIDKQQGIVANIIVQNGTLKIGDIIVAGNISGRVKRIFSTQDSKLLKAGPSSVVQILGFAKIPESGLIFNVCQEEKEIKHYTSKYNASKKHNTFHSKVLLSKQSNKTNIKKLNLIMRTDTRGSLEAILNSFSQIPQNKVQLNLVSVDSGNISRSDIELALTSQSLIIGFNIDIISSIEVLSKNKGIIISTFNVIYELLDFITNKMLDMVEPEYDHIVIGKAEVQTIFNINKGFVAGCIVTEGKLQKMCYINVYRANDLIYTGLLNSLKRMKEDVNEVFANHECGVLSEDYNLWKSNDIIEAYELKEKTKVL